MLEDASVPLSTCNRACLARALSLSHSLVSLSLLSFSHPLFSSLSRVRARSDLPPFSSDSPSLSLSLARSSNPSLTLSLFLSPLSPPAALSLSFPLLPLALSHRIGLGGAAACTLPVSLLHVNSLAAISPAVLVAQERVEPIMSPRAPGSNPSTQSWPLARRTAPRRAVLCRRLLTSRPWHTLSGLSIIGIIIICTLPRAYARRALRWSTNRPTDRPTGQTTSSSSSSSLSSETHSAEEERGGKREMPSLAP